MKCWKTEAFRWLEALIGNEKINLTAITNSDEMDIKHFIDSILAFKTGLLDGEKKIIDIGTGAGFPAIPLKIVNRKLKVDMVDGLNKRIIFLKDIIGKLKLKNTRAFHARAEIMSKEEEYREKYDVAISRAVAPLNILLELTMPFVKIGGYFIAMKGPRLKEELEQSKNAIKKLSGKEEKIISLDLLDEGERYILIVKKINKISKKYPRSNAQIKKNPL